MIGFMDMITYTDWPEEEIQRRSQALKILKSALRLRILAALAEADSNVTDLAAHIRVSQPLLSWHLNQLRQAEFVTSERRGRQVRYQLDRGALRAVLHDVETLLGLEPEPNATISQTGESINNECEETR